MRDPLKSLYGKINATYLETPKIKFFQNNSGLEPNLKLLLNLLSPLPDRIATPLQRFQSVGFATVYRFLPNPLPLLNRGAHAIGFKHRFSESFLISLALSSLQPSTPKNVAT